MAYDKKCILCGKNKFATVNKKGILKKGGPVLKFNNIICKNCGLVFMCPQPKEDDYREIYKKYEKSRYAHENEDKTRMTAQNDVGREKAKEIHNFLKEYLNSESKILDIGCGFGQISNHFKNTFKYNISAIEPSAVLSKIVREKFGVNVFCGSFDDFYEENTEKFNLLVMQHVFEHFIDPIKKLSQFKNLFLPNGVVYIEIPDVASFKKPVNQFFDYMHPFSYSPKTFKELVYKNGYKIIKVNKEKKYRLQAVIALKSSSYQDVGSDAFWVQGGYFYTKIFILKRKLIDLCH
ncbi:class I SAM-dependent methyltransferase [Patescibacteria group bacterium]|nr:class I SAM-dependent methyltransferase [Patescibacteria group bacterium]